VCGREGLAVKSLPSEHAGGKRRLTYAAASGRSGNLELDVNYLLRTPLWPAELADSRRVGSFQATQVRLLDLHEIAAGKLAALLSRNASRDIFDGSSCFGAAISIAQRCAWASSSTAARTEKTGAPYRSRT